MHVNDDSLYAYHDLLKWIFIEILINYSNYENM